MFRVIFDQEILLLRNDKSVLPTLEKCFMIFCLSFVMLAKPLRDTDTILAQYKWLRVAHQDNPGIPVGQDAPVYKVNRYNYDNNQMYI